MSFRLFCSVCLTTCPILAQLISNETAIPKTALPPVVFVNGYQNTCTSSTFANTFGVFDQLLQATNRVSLFFDNCAFSGKPSIEDLGNDFRDYLTALRYVDATPVPAVDVVAHSMGGLIVRSYLAGKQNFEGMFQPPTTIALRKVVFLATPHFGSPIASQFGLGLDAQTRELSNGSLFVFDLNTWNQGTDDLRGVDALALAGNGGTGRAIAPNFDDGVVSLTSASIGFAKPGKTRIIPYCHTGPGLVTIAGFCPADAPGIAVGVRAADTNAAAVLSFLNGSTDWQTIGQAAEQNLLLKASGGLQARAQTASGQFVSITSAKASKDLNVAGNAVTWTESLPATAQDLVITSPGGTFESKFNEPAGYVTSLLVKPGPFINRIFPAAAIPATLAAAPGMFISIYGTGLVSTATLANSLPLPTILGGAQVLVNGAAIPLQFAGPTQINGIIPASAQGLVKLLYSANMGASVSQTINVLVQPTLPEIFTQDQSGAGPAAALNAVTNALVTSAAPLLAGDYVALFLTGLGAVHSQEGLQVADLQPTVVVGGKTCAVTYAGRAPGYDGLDQINCRLAADVPANAAAAVIVTSGGVVSNAPTLAIQ